MLISLLIGERESSMTGNCNGWLSTIYIYKGYKNIIDSVYLWLTVTQVWLAVDKYWIDVHIASIETVKQGDYNWPNSNNTNVLKLSVPATVLTCTVASYELMWDLFDVLVPFAATQLLSRL